MIILGMNRKEIQKQVSEDFILLNRYIDSQRSRLGYWSDKAVNGESKSFEWKSQNGNTWTALFIREKNEVATIFFTSVESDSGRFILKPQLTHDGYVLVTFIPHFFRRYRERIKLSRKLTTMQVVKRFMKRNRTAHMSVMDNRNIELTYSEGIGLGYWIGLRHRLVNTFITYDMAYGDQVERFEDSEAKRRERCERFGRYDDEVRSELCAFGLSDEEIYERIKDKKEQDGD